jgi:two-component system CheB/CheR fusion protein
MDDSDASGEATSLNASSAELVPVVGLGASAGGLLALEQFLANVPPDSGVAFVVVTHQHPDHSSMLHELLGRKTTMPVHALRDEACTIQPDHVYVAPPGRVLAIMGNRLHVHERESNTPLFLPIDIFFRSLAEDRKERAVGVILSGTGADGTIGIKEIKAVLGMVMVQEESNATYAGMPHSAIQTGVVDYVLPVDEIPAQLLSYMQQAGHVVLDTGTTANALRAFDGIFLLLRRHTGNDFSHYKLSTVERRIERRMNVRHIASISAYLEYLHEFPEEINLLFHDLLIGVTSFFRDPDAFNALAEQLPGLLASRKRERILRLWVPGCSTGEEAYSLAILLCELMERSGRSFEAQIFATDIDPDAIEIARKGCYPVGIAHHVTPERLSRFFLIQDDMFRIKKEVRELVIFSTQNLISDPPFIKLDLVSCRNLLIYFDASVQQRLLPMFHYALRPGGLLFLGSSESVGSHGASFEILDKRWKLFRRTESSEGQYVSTLSLQSPHGPPVSPTAGPSTNRPVPSQAASIERMLLQEIVPPTVIINERGDVMHVHGRTGRFLEPAPGAQHSVSVFDMAREGLRLELSAAVRQVTSEAQTEVFRRGVQVGSNGGTLLVDIRVKRVRDTDRLRNMLLITFERARPFVAASSREHTRGPHLDRMLEIERELQHTKESHQGTIEELETSNEELKSTNEELQSTNEELQSANEELETSKEEMQSLNEELQTVNAELQGKIEELSRANDDMKNLLNGTDIATVFLDNELNIMRYTEQAKRVIRLIQSDVGRPISDLVSHLRHDRLVEDAHEVLRTLVFKESEVQLQDGRWYLMRILPYRTIENVIDGLVITFIDITKFKALQHSEARLNNLLRTSPTAILGQDSELRYTWISGTAFGRKATVGQSDADLFAPREAERLTAIKRSVLETGTPRRETVKLTVDSEERTYDIYLQPLETTGEGATELASIATDVTTRTYEP